MDAVYLDLRKAFNSVSHNILIDKLAKHGLDKWTMRWTENWLNCRAQGVLISNTKSTWTKFTSDVSQGLIMRPVLYNIFINDLERVHAQQVCR